MANPKLQINDEVYFIDSRIMEKRPFVNGGGVFYLDEARDFLAVRVYHDETHNFAISDLGKLVFTSAEEASKAISILPDAGTGMYLIHDDNSISRVVIDHYCRQCICLTSKEVVPIEDFNKLLYPSKEAAVQALKKRYYG